VEPVSVASHRWLCLFVVVLAALPSKALAEDTAPGLRLSIGGFYPKADTTIRLDANQSNRGTSANFEDTFGLDQEKTVGWFDARWRLSPRHSLQFTYFNLNREGTRDLNRQVQFGEQTFNIGAQVNSRVDLDVARVAYGYSFVSGGRNELTGLIGVHATRLRAQISTANGSQSEEAKGTAPLPMLGLMGVLGFSDRARLRGWAQFFALSYGDYDGRLTNYAATLEFDVFKNFGLGVGWFDYKLNLEATKQKLTGEFDLHIRGPVAYLNFLF